MSSTSDKVLTGNDGFTVASRKDRKNWPRVIPAAVIQEKLDNSPSPFKVFLIQANRNKAYFASLTLGKNYNYFDSLAMDDDDDFYPADDEEVKNFSYFQNMKTQKSSKPRYNATHDDEKCQEIFEHDNVRHRKPSKSLETVDKRSATWKGIYSQPFRLHRLSSYSSVFTLLVFCCLVSTNIAQNACSLLGQLQILSSIPSNCQNLPKLKLSDENFLKVAYYWSKYPAQASSMFGPIQSWDTSQITNFQNVFGSSNQYALQYGGGSNWNKNLTFPKDVFSKWNVFKVTDMSYAFNGATTNITWNFTTWNVENVLSMNSMFAGSNMNGDLSKWKTSRVTDTSRMFSGAYTFNQNLSSWNTSRVTFMTQMFQNAIVFNGDVSQWNVGRVLYFDRMFYNASAFNADIEKWNTESALSLAGMFQHAASFNSRITRWNVKNVGNMQDTFSSASKFSQRLCWNTYFSFDPFQNTPNAYFDDYPMCTYFHMSIIGTLYSFNSPKMLVNGGSFSLPYRDTLSISNNQTLIFTIPTTVPAISETMIIQFNFLLLIARGIRHSICFYPYLPISSIPLQNDYCLDLDGSSVANTVSSRPNLGSISTMVIKLAEVKSTLKGTQPKYIVFINDVGVGKSSTMEISNINLRDSYPLSIASPSSSQLFVKAFNASLSVHDNYWLKIIRGDGDQELPKTMKGNPYPQGVLNDGLIVTDLVPGKRYKVLYQPYVNNTIDETAIDSFYGVGIVTCSCPDNNGMYPSDQTGRPINLTIGQKYGFVSMNFTDSSVCEEAYSFTRITGAGISISYASNYYFYARSKCGNNLVPGQSYADDLSLSRLDVGSTFTYCAQAVAPQYIADSNSVSAYRMSSDAACQDVTIAWEASVQGLITSKASAGSVPIAGVTVTWMLVDADGKTPLSCTNPVSVCSSGSTVVKTDKSGSFEAEFFVQEPNLRLTRTNPVSVLFNFSKSFDGQYSTFLVNNEETTIVPSAGHVMYLHHVQFDTPLFVVDASTVPFTGSVYVRNTPYGAYRGCPVIGAYVCAYEIKQLTVGESSLKQPLACQDTDSDGYYNLPLPVGSIVHNVTVTYFEHEFIPTSPNIGASWVDQLQNGITIIPSKTYTGNNFIDTTIAPVELEVAGGRCNITMGLSMIKYKILGCSWPGATFMQYAKTMQYVPAFVIQFSNVQVVLRGQTAPLKAITEYFSDKQETADMRKYVDPLAKSLSVNSDQSPSSSASSSNMTYVRFQYDGILSMSLKVNSTESPNCRGQCQDPSSSLFYQSCDSLHVVNFLSVVEINVSVFFVLPSGETCDLVESGTNVTLRNHLGYENNAGFEKTNFYKSLSSEEKENLRICYPSCVNEVTYIDDADAGLHNLVLYTGRPEVIRPYTRSLSIRVDGYTSSGEYRSVSHLASFVIQGLYKDGDGLSFAFPTHTPVMVLRDPPGGTSSATYENVRTTLTVDSQELTVTADYTFKYDFTVFTGITKQLCVGVGAEVCLEEKAKFSLKMIDFALNLGSRAYYWKKEVSSSKSTVWSIQTSSDPWLAGSMSDIFVGKFTWYTLGSLG